MTKLALGNAGKLYINPSIIFSIGKLFSLLFKEGKS